MSNRPSVWMQDLTWQEVEEYLKHDRIAIIPIGSTEQHGPAGPLGLDTYVAATLAEDVAQRTGVLVTPPLWFGDSSHHTGFPGTLSLRTETLSLVVRDISRSLARHGFNRILIINGHKGANLPAISTSVRNLHETELPGVLFAVADPLHLARSLAKNIKVTNEHHAGELEMSHIHYRFPGLIRTDRLTSDSDSVDFDAVFGASLAATCSECTRTVSISFGAARSSESSPPPAASPLRPSSPRRRARPTTTTW